MPTENAEAVRAMYEAFNRGDPDTAELLHPEAELHQHPDIPDSGSYYGRDEFVGALQRWLSGWEDFRFQPEEVVDVGDHVVMQILLSGRGRSSGIESTTRFFHVWSFRDGKPHSCYVRSTRAEALEAARTASA